MKEKFKELLKQSTNPPWDGEQGPMNEFNLEKFAELIVKECANQCTTKGPFVAEVVWGKQFHKKILEHFGVEE